MTTKQNIILNLIFINWNIIYMDSIIPYVDYIHS